MSFRSNQPTTQGNKSEPHSSAGRILIIFPGALGDLMCMLPAMRALERHYGRLELMARAELAEFAAGRMGIARAHSIDRRETSLLFSPAPDAALQAREFFGGFAHIHCFFAAGNDRVRQVLPEACGGEVYFHPFRPETEGHVAWAYFQSVRDVIPGLEVSAAGLELRDDDLVAARRIAAAHGVAQHSYVLLMPGSGSRTKNWPAENYLRIARHLPRATALVILGPAEEHLHDCFPGVPAIVRPPLGALAGLARMAAAFVGNDSGVSHLAAAAGAPGVVIFGPTDPSRWRPLGAVAVLRRMPLGELDWREVGQALAGVRRRAE